MVDCPTSMQNWNHLLHGELKRMSEISQHSDYRKALPQFEVVPQPVGQMPWGHVRPLAGMMQDDKNDPGGSMD